MWSRGGARSSDRGPSPGPGRPRLAPLDGLRAIAVLGVMAFHFGSTWLAGGFFGVDIFYVLSGFLITGLLLEEWGRTGRLRLAAFWARRARRLLPALAVLLLAITWYVHSVAPVGSYPGYRMDALATLFYFSNWHQIATSADYFVSTGLVSPLTHCWSLAIEEQFYLVWPPVLLVVLTASRNLVRATRLLLALSVAGALASAVWMAVLYQRGAATTRLYFGTDTHAQCILVGAALACGLRLWRRAARSGDDAPVLRTRGARWAVDAAALGGLAGLVLAAHRLTGDSPLTYQGGFLLVALATAAVILAGVGVRGGLTARLLGLAPLPWVGRISYGLYLWHFPAAIVLSPARTGLTGLPLAAARVAATFAVAALSYYGVERPVLERRFWRSARALVPAGVGAVAVTAVIVAATVGPAVSEASAVRYRPAPVSAASGVASHLPARVVVLGDSTALTLAYALSATAPTGTTVANDGLFGCGLVVGAGTSGHPPRLELPFAPACNASTPADQRWPADDQRAVADTAPGDVVLFLAGYDDIQDTLQNGSWSNITSARFQRMEQSNLETLESIATSHGAHLDLLTMLCTDVTYTTGGPPVATDSVLRHADFDRLLRHVAASHRDAVSVIDYGSMLCPRGRFVENLDGVQIRTPDGIHTPAYVPGNPYAGNSSASVAGRFYSWVAGRLWPQIAATGMSVPTPR